MTNDTAFILVNGLILGVLVIQFKRQLVFTDVVIAFSGGIFVAWLSMRLLNG